MIIKNIKASKLNSIRSHSEVVTDIEVNRCGAKQKLAE